MDVEQHDTSLSFATISPVASPRIGRTTPRRKRRRNGSTSAIASGSGNENANENMEMSMRMNVDVVVDDEDGMIDVGAPGGLGLDLGMNEESQTQEDSQGTYFVLFFVIWHISSCGRCMYPPTHNAYIHPFPPLPSYLSPLYLSSLFSLSPSNNAYTNPPLPLSPPSPS